MFHIDVCSLLILISCNITVQAEETFTELYKKKSTAKFSSQQTFPAIRSFDRKLMDEKMLEKMLMEKSARTDGYIETVGVGEEREPCLCMHQMQPRN